MELYQLFEYLDEAGEIAFNLPNSQGERLEYLINVVRSALLERYP